MNPASSGQAVGRLGHILRAEVWNGPRVGVVPV
jgi:hypothetical protein